MIVDIVDKYRTDDNNPIKNLRLKILKLLIRTAEDRLRIPWPGGAIHMPLDKVRYFLKDNSNFFYHLFYFGCPVS
jgi:hypothetical protein